MKKVALLNMLAFILCFTVKAANADLFKLDETKINMEIAQLTELEKLIVSNENITAFPISGYNNLLMNIEPANLIGLDFSIEDIQWGSFVWGFCCWPIGIFTVLLNDEKDRNHKISYFIGAGGCISLSLISALASPPTYYVY